MKTAILTAAMMILMTAAVSARTIDDNINPGSPEKIEFKAKVFQPGSSAIGFRIANPSSDKVVLKLYNEKHVKVFHKVVKKNINLSVKCDLANAASGIYTAVVFRNGKEEIRKEFVILN